jgi:hypothetical protein
MTMDKAKHRSHGQDCVERNGDRFSTSILPLYLNLTLNDVLATLGPGPQKLDSKISLFLYEKGNHVKRK